MMCTEFPGALQTERLHLRCWQSDDADELLPLLIANAEHLGAWIPEQVAKPAPLPDLAERLAGYAANFAAQREWRFAIFASRDDSLLGEASLFPRSAAGRVPYADADRLEIGYWLRADATGRGYATEAAQALLDLAASLPRMLRVEIRCDARNIASAAVPRRLGLHLAESEDADCYDMIWYCGLPPAQSTL